MPLFNSTAISEAEYDQVRQELTIWFRQGPHPYVYFDVPQMAYDGLLAAASKGHYVATYIQPVYGFRR